MRKINNCSDCDYNGQLWASEPLFWDDNTNDFIYGKEERYFVRCVNDGCGKRSSIKTFCIDAVEAWNEINKIGGSNNEL